MSTIEGLKKSGKYLDEQVTMEDSYKNKVVIPAGFKIAEDSGNTIPEGIVIEDNDIINGKGKGRGNQYVWIPVSNIDGSTANPIKSDETEQIVTLGRYYFSSGVESLKQAISNCGSIVYIQDYYCEKTIERTGVAKDLLGFRKSVSDNGGYYIARYEASYGIDEKPNSKVSDGYIETSGTKPTTEGVLWNNISELDASSVSKTLYTEKDEEKVNSDLMNSYAWDTAVSFIQKFSNNKTYSMAGSTNSSINNTGKNNDEVCKINDMASNLLEWTTEHCTATYSSVPYLYVIRGGCCQLPTTYYTSNRYGNCASDDKLYRTFRTILYL